MAKRFTVAGLGLEPRTSAYETDEITIFYTSRNKIKRGFGSFGVSG